MNSTGPATGPACTKSCPTTTALVHHLMRLRDAPLTPEAATVGKQCLMDWLGVALAGRNQPLVRILTSSVTTAAGSDACTLIGLGRRAHLDDAILINGAMGHALDFDDVIAVMGHPSAPVAPVVLALAEALGCHGADALQAFVVGVEAESRVGALMGPSHYAAGWHGTATFGAFGAAAAAACLLDLNEEQWLHAMGMAGALAAGLQSSFGTMTKAMQVGRAAQNGLLAARLAAGGFSADTDTLGSTQGFARTQSTSVDMAAALDQRSQPHVTDVLFKYHAACYFTHNAIEACRSLLTAHRLAVEEIASVTIQVQPMHMQICNIASPRTGLECKFSLRMVCALALSGEDTGDDAIFNDDTARRADLIDLCSRMVVAPTADSPAATVTIVRDNGEVLRVSADIGIPERHLPTQQSRLERKFRRNAAAAIDGDATDIAISLLRTLDQQPDLRALLATCAVARP